MLAPADEDGHSTSDDDDGHDDTRPLVHQRGRLRQHHAEEEGTSPVPAPQERVRWLLVATFFVSATLAVLAAAGIDPRRIGAPSQPSAGLKPEAHEKVAALKSQLAGPKALKASQQAMLASQEAMLAPAAAIASAPAPAPTAPPAPVPPAAGSTGSLCSPRNARKIPSCGATGCGYIFTASGKMWIKKTYKRKWWSLLNNTKHAYARLNRQCRGIVYPETWCDDGVVYPYNPEHLYLDSWKTRSDPQLGKHVNVSEDDMLRFAQFAVNSIAPCVAARGMVFYDLSPQHVLVTHDTAEPILMYDIDMWRRKEWYNSSVEIATKQNLSLLKEMFCRAVHQRKMKNDALDSFISAIPNLMWDQCNLPTFKLCSNYPFEKTKRGRDPLADCGQYYENH